MMTEKDTDRVNRDNVLNNYIAINKAKEVMNLQGISWKEEIYFTKEYITNFFGVDDRTIERLVENNREELTQNGYKVITKPELDSFLSNFGTDNNVGTKITKLGVYSFRSFLNVAMLLHNNDRAKQIRSQLLDITLGVLSERTGGHNIYINQRDPEFIETAYTNEKMRKRFTNALNLYVDMGTYKYEYFTNVIYKGIFLENAKEYQQILRLKSRANLRDTMYTEVLENIASIEAGVAKDIEIVAKKKGNLLTKEEVEGIIQNLITHPAFSIYTDKARKKMASRDMCFRDAYHKNLKNYINAVDPEDFERFLGEKSKALAQQIDDHIEVFKRLRDK